MAEQHPCQIGDITDIQYVVELLITGRSVPVTGRKLPKQPALPCVLHCSAIIGLESASGSHNLKSQDLFVMV